MSRTARRRALQGLTVGACSVLAACGPKGLGPWQEEVRQSPAGRRQAPTASTVQPPFPRNHADDRAGPRRAVRSCR